MTSSTRTGWAEELPIAAEVRTFVDTNVLVYAVDRADPIKREQAQQLLGSLQDFVLSAQVLGEFYVTATRKLEAPLSAVEAGRAVESLAGLPTVPLDSRLVAEAIQIHHQDRLSYWDGLILAAAEAAGCARLLTEDLSDGQIIRGVQIENPFIAAG